jgi:hypothetical protein
MIHVTRRSPALPGHLISQSYSGPGGGNRNYDAREWHSEAFMEGPQASQFFSSTPSSSRQPVVRNIIRSGFGYSYCAKGYR